MRDKIYQTIQLMVDIIWMRYKNDKLTYMARWENSKNMADCRHCFIISSLI